MSECNFKARFYRLAMGNSGEFPAHDVVETIFCSLVFRIFSIRKKRRFSARVLKTYNLVIQKHLKDQFGHSSKVSGHEELSLISYCEKFNDH